jgi:FKBP-type peptidyl-prolyl cis-trans isomerase
MLTQPKDLPTMPVPSDKTSYAIGLDIGHNLSRLPVAVDAASFCQGVSDVLGNHPPQVSEEEFRALMQAFQQTLQAHQATAAKGQAAENRRSGAAFLKENGAKAGVVTTASGLQYEVLKAGKGRTPAATDTVTVHYTGRLVDGTVFDSSESRGEPAQFPLNRVIPGWSEGVGLMKVGAKHRLVVPASLAYGERGAGNVIGPDATLVFDVELLSIDS